MNLLFVFLKNVKDPELSKLSVIAPRGTTGEVWHLMREQAAHGDFDKQSILSETKITLAHLDKITSELLARCYQAIFGDDEIALLYYLSSRVSLNKLFYAALPRFLKGKSETQDVQRAAESIKLCLDMIQDNMPFVYRDEKTIKSLAAKYLALHKGEEKKEAAFFIECRLQLYDMERFFAALEFSNNKEEIRARIDTLPKPESQYGATAVVEYYKLRLYFYQAGYEHQEGIVFGQSALAYMRIQPELYHTWDMLRVELKINEFMYFTSRFHEAFERYHALMTSPETSSIPEFHYHQAKYVQLAMITGHLDAAGAVFDRMFAAYGERTRELMLIRDIVTYIKYCLLKGDYDIAFEYIQLGFEKNFKSTYFQYELELRNLQTAYFYLTGHADIALETSKKHLKFLRNNGYTADNTYTPYYTVIKAIFDLRGRGQLSARHQQMFDTYQKGSFAVYGALLQRMMAVRS